MLGSSLPAKFVEEGCQTGGMDEEGGKSEKMSHISLSLQHFLLALTDHHWIWSSENQDRHRRHTPPTSQIN